MKAAQINSYGGPEVIEVLETKKPEPLEGQVLIEVYSSSINPFDDKVKAGAMSQMRPLEFPATIGGDIAGMITDPAGKFKVGDKVWGQANIFGGGSGALAEYATTTEDQVGLMPKNLDFDEAGVMPLVGLSALQALIDKLGLERDQKILIQGASGGIGTVAVQLAKHLGAYVIGTATGPLMEFVRELGADEVIDYKKDDFRRKVSKVDAIFDTVGGEVNEHSYEVLRAGGKITSMAAAPNEELAKKYSVVATHVFTKATTESLDSLARLVERGAIKPVIEKIYPLSEIQEAYRTFEKGSLKGKIGIQIKS